MKRFIKSKKGLVLLATLVVAAAAAIGAYAYFTATGTGNGTASVGTSTGWHVTVSSDNTALYPGQGTAHDSYTVANNGGGNELLHQVTIQIANNNGSAWSFCAGGGTNNAGTCSGGTANGDQACTAADFSVNGGAAGATATDTYGVSPTNDYAPNTGPSNVAFTVQMVDGNYVQDACQGATPPILVSAS